MSTIDAHFFAIRVDSFENATWLFDNNLREQADLWQDVLICWHDSASSNIAMRFIDPIASEDTNFGHLLRDYRAFAETMSTKMTGLIGYLEKSYQLETENRDLQEEASKDLHSGEHAMQNARDLQASAMSKLNSATRALTSARSHVKPTSQLNTSV